MVVVIAEAAVEVEVGEGEIEEEGAAVGAVEVEDKEEVEEAELRREAPSLDGRAAEEATGRAAAGWLATAGEAARPITGGVDTRGVEGAEDFGVAGFDQDSKKSSSSAFAAGVAAAAPAVSMPSMWIPSGNLWFFH